MTSKTETKRKTREARFTLVHVHNNEGQWVGQFVDHDAAADWIKTRMKPEMFTIDDSRREGSAVTGGVYVSAKIVKNVKAADPVTGFLPNPEFEGVPLTPATGPAPRRKAGKRASTPARATGTGTGTGTPAPSDDEALRVALAASYAEDATDDTTREHEELSL